MNRNKGGQKKGEFKKKESILKLEKYINKHIIVKYLGGRQVSGELVGFDPLQNLVLDNTKEYIRDFKDPSQLTDETRDLGLVVCRSTAVVLISPLDGTEQIENPFQ